MDTNSNSNKTNKSISFSKDTLDRIDALSKKYTSNNNRSSMIDLVFQHITEDEIKEILKRQFN